MLRGEQVQRPEHGMHRGQLDLHAVRSERAILLQRGYLSDGEDAVREREVSVVLRCSSCLQRGAPLAAEGCSRVKSARATLNFVGSLSGRP